MTKRTKSVYNHSMEQKFRPVLSVRIFAGEEKCFGPGVAELLRRVEEHHSLRAAANSMCMAYSKAWTVIKNAEAALGFRLLRSSTGGKNGGGATLSPDATKLLTAYEEYCVHIRSVAADSFAELFGDLLRKESSE